MKGKKKKEEDISSETPEKKPAQGGRLSGMIESMQKRGSPVNAHRVATAYFDSFRKERNIPGGAEPPEAPDASGITAVDTGEKDAVITAVDSAVKKEPSEKKASKEASRAAPGPKDQDPMLTPSEQKVYRAIYKESMGRGSKGLRLGLKELKELTGLSDKTVRIAVHSLEKKLSIEIVEPSLGIYGRKYRVFSPDEVQKRRTDSELVLDPVTKKVLSRSTPVVTTVNNAVNTGVSTAVITAVDTPVGSPEERKAGVALLYEKYTGNKWGDVDDGFYDTAPDADIRIIETAILLTVLKGVGCAGGIGDILPVLGQLGTRLPAGYLENLREVWKRLKESGSGD